MVNPADKTDDELREIILTAGKNVEAWKATERNFGIINKSSKSTGQNSESGSVQKRLNFRQSKKFENKTPQRTDNYQTRRKEVS
jgi:hypothetical protein